MRVQGIATRYRQILREMSNNRLFEPQLPGRLEAQIVSPLITLALDDFPDSAESTAAFAESGDDSIRDSAIEVYDIIIAIIRQVLARMERTEDHAAIIETLKIILNMEGKVEGLVEKALEAEGAGIFDPPPDKRDKQDKDKNK